MAIRSAKDMIHEARILSGMTQEDMADGICSVQALSQIENGVMNARPATFESLMRRAGFPHTRFPVFADRDDFECYCSLKYAHIHLDAWQLEPAWKELQKIKELRWTGSRFYYQEWLFLYARLQFRSYACRHEYIYDILLAAIRITRPCFTPEAPDGTPLAKIELEIITALAQEAFSLGRRKECVRIVDYAEHCLGSGLYSCLSDMERTRLQAEAAIVRVKCLFAAAEYGDAFRIADEHRHQMVTNNESAPLFELTFLAGLCGFCSGQTDEADALIKASYYTAHHVGSCYASVCLAYLQQETAFPVTEQMLRLPGTALKEYPPETVDASLASPAKASTADKAYDYAIGDIIRDLRLEQNLSQSALCYGLCSKSKLSKIESKTLQPDIALTEALLQRLGVSERIFTFWGSEREAAFYRLKFETMHMSSKSQKEQISRNIDKMEGLLKENDILLKQECLSARALKTLSLKERLQLLTDALHCTLPEFDIHRIMDYRLSWQELNILNSITHIYGKLDTADGTQTSILYLLQLRNYLNKLPMDIALCTNLQSIISYIHCHVLYKAKNFSAVAAFPEKNNLLYMRYHLDSYSFYLFFYCQALGECGWQENALLYGALACNMNYFTGFQKNIPLLKRYFMEDFNLLIAY